MVSIVQMAHTGDTSHTVRERSTVYDPFSAFESLLVLSVDERGKRAGIERNILQASCLRPFPDED